MRRVVVTGLGVLSACGHAVDEFDQALREGRSGLGLIQRFDPSWFHTRVAAEVRDYSFDALIPATEQRHLDRFTLLGLVAADEAVRRSGFDASADSFRCGVILGTGMGSTLGTEEGLIEVQTHQRKPRPSSVPKCMYNAPCGQVSIRHGLRGPTMMIVTACSSSAHAISQAAAMIRAGTADAFLAGGTESIPSYSLWAAWDNLRVMSRDNDHPERSCRPFSRDREGFVMGEGAAVLVLESEERARARGAEILAEVAGSGLSSDAHHITRPQVDGLVAAIQGALDDAGLNPTDIGYVNAHGTATSTNDPLEVAALKQVFGDHALRVPVSSTKSGHGHTIGAAGAMEAVAGILAMNGGYLPPTLHLTDPDPECDLDFVPGEAREQSFEAMLSNSFAFGGHNVVLALRRYRG